MGEDGLNFVGGEQTVKGFLHEQFPEKAKISRNTEEVQAESISYAVCAYFGIETGENSFGYIAIWSKGKELPELKSIVREIDPDAFVILLPAAQVLGEGFRVSGEEL